MFCFVENNKILSGIVTTDYGTGLIKEKKNGFSTHFRLKGIVDRVTIYCLPYIVNV
jgi:hypothetical protein